MFLYRHCSYEDFEAIVNNDFSKLCRGSKLFEYTSSIVNYYPNFKKLQKNIAKTTDLDSKIKLIKQMFPNLPNLIPIIETDYQKRLNLYKKFESRHSYHASSIGSDNTIEGSHFIEERDDTYLYTIKCMAFFDTCPRMRNFEDADCVLVINIDDNIAKNYMGFGDYGETIYPEYAIPTYLIQPEDICFVEVRDNSGNWEWYVFKGCKTLPEEDVDSRFQRLGEDLKRAEQRYNQIKAGKFNSYREYFRGIDPEIHFFTAPIKIYNKTDENNKTEDTNIIRDLTNTSELI